MFSRVVREPRLARIEVAYLLFSLAEFATWTAITVYAFGRGGLRETGVAAAVQLVAAALATPFTSYLGDRVRRDFVLAGGFAATALSAGAAALAIGADAPGVLVYAVATGVTVSSTVSRPAVSALLPALTDTAEGLTAASVGIDVIVHSAIFVGPALAGGLLAAGDADLVFAVSAGLCLVAAIVVVGLRLEGARVRPTGHRGESLAADLRAGFAVGWRDRQARVMVGLTAVGSVIGGALDVFFVSIAFEFAGGGASLAGFLGAAAGFGGLVGAMSSIGLIGGARLRPAIGAAAAIAAVPLLGIVAAPGRTMALAGLTLCGVGIGVLQVAARTFLQRTTADDIFVRVFGVMEGTSQLALAAGALGAGLTSEALGSRTALAIVAGLLPFGVALAWVALGRADREIRPPDRGLLSALRDLPEFAALGPAALEQLALNARAAHARNGDVIIRRGDVGDRYYVVMQGEVRVHHDGFDVARLGPGDAFGEVALMRSVPRTADVTACADTDLIAVGRTVFLEAVTSHPRVADALDAVITGRT